MNAAQPAPCIGVLALQGAFTAHEDALRSLHVATRQVRTPADLTQVAALVMPGGESTTMARLLETSQMFDELSARISAGMPASTRSTAKAWSRTLGSNTWRHRA